MTCKNCFYFEVLHCAFHRRIFSLEELVLVTDGGLPEWCKEEEGSIYDKN